MSAQDIKNPDTWSVMLSFPVYSRRTTFKTDLANDAAHPMLLEYCGERTLYNIIIVTVTAPGSKFE